MVEYFKRMGVKVQTPGSVPLDCDMPVSWRAHTGYNRHADQHKILRGFPVVITVTHPHRNWVSFASRNKSYESNLSCWCCLLDELPNLNYYLFDINCRESNRKGELINMLHFLDLYTEKRERWTDEWINEWPIMSSRDSKHKKQYLENQMLPSGYNYSQLQFAVDWYESLPSNDY